MGTRMSGVLFDRWCGFEEKQVVVVVLELVGLWG